MAVLAILWLAIPNTANAQLLENRGKLKTAKSEGRGFLHFLKRGKVKSADPAGSFSGKKGKVKYSPSPKPVKKSNPKYSEPSGVLNFSSDTPSPRYSPSNDKRFNGKKSKSKSISGSMNWFGSDGRKSYFNSSVSGFQGHQRRPSRIGSKLYFKDLSRVQSKLVVKTPPIQRKWPEAGYQGFSKGFNRDGNKTFYRKLSREKSKILVSTYPLKNATRNSHKYKGLDNGKNRRGSKLYFRELSREQSKTVVKYSPTKRKWPEAGFQGSDKGRTRFGNKLFYSGLSQDKSGVVVSYEKTRVRTAGKMATYTGDFKGRTRMGNQLFYSGKSNDQSGIVVGYEKTRVVTAGKMATYTGGFKTPKRNNKMHPSASYVYGKRASSASQKELFRKLNVLWVRVNRNKAQPDSVKNRPEKLKFDKKEKDLWNY